MHAWGLFEASSPSFWKWISEVCRYFLTLFCSSGTLALGSEDGDHLRRQPKQRRPPTRIRAPSCVTRLYYGMCAVLTLSLAPQTVSTLSSSGGIKKEADEVLTACRGGGLVGGASRGPDSERDVNQLSSSSHTQTYLDQADSKSGFHLNWNCSAVAFVSRLESFFTQAKTIVCAHTPAPSPAVLLQPSPHRSHSPSFCL